MYKETVKINHKRISSNGGYTAPTAYYTVSPGYQEFEHVHYARTVLSTLPVRNLQFNTADTIGMHGIKKVLNLLSIIGKSNRINVLRL